MIMNHAQNNVIFPVRLTINSRHILPQMGCGAYTMFSGGPQTASMQSEKPEDALIEALEEKLENEEEYQMQTLFEEFGLESVDEAEEQAKDVINRMEEMFRVLFEQDTSDENSNRYILTTEGTMEIDDNEYRLHYTEDPDNGFGAAPTTIHIPKIGQSVMIERSGTLMSTLYCEKGKRHMSNYTSPMMPMPFLVCIYTRKCENTITENGGVLLLDYLVELRGADIQRTTMRINVSRLPALMED